MTLLLPTGKELNTPASLLRLERAISNPCWQDKPLEPWMPRGLRSVVATAGAGAAGALSPQLLPLLLATSPRIMGKAARGVGKTGRALDTRLAQMLKPSHATFQAGRAERVAE